MHSEDTRISMFILACICGVFFIDTPNNIYSFELDYGLQILISTISTILCTIGEGIDNTGNVDVTLKIIDVVNTCIHISYQKKME